MTPLFHLAPSAIRLSRRFAFPGACSVKLATTSELTMADPPSTQSDEMDAVSIDSDRAEPGAADANRLVLEVSVPAGTSATALTSSSSALQVDGHNGEAQKNATALGGTCERCPPAGATFTWGPDGEHAPNRGDRNRPVRSPEAGPGIYCRGLGQRIVGKNASTQFIH